jgi:hypothetical protein
MFEYKHSNELMMVMTYRIDFLVDSYSGKDDHLIIQYY